MADVGNPGSVLRSISSARESLRIVRPLVPRSAWECMNRLHLDALDDTALCASVDIAAPSPSGSWPAASSSAASSAVR